jgi:2-keto-4-pentenoate hydratase/2-oxohepta-3-ene-1,7-dioic acid hydratase in catechol pathway
MRIVRYQSATGPAYGLAEDGTVHQLVGDPFAAPSAGQAVAPLDGFQLLAPCEPSKVVCVGRNYHSLLADQGRTAPPEPFLFLKTANAVIGPDAVITRPPGVTRLVPEAELAVVIGRTLGPATRATVDLQASWQSYVLGYTCGNDVTAVDWQDQTVQWARAKSSDTMCPLGPWIETDPGNLNDLAIRAYLNGTLLQDGSTSDILFDIPAILAYISATITLVPGDVVLTGTPPGRKPLVDGDVIEVEVGGIGRLANRVADGR